MSTPGLDAILPPRCAHERAELWVVVQSNGECVRPICERCRSILPIVPKKRVADRYAQLPRIPYAEAARRRDEMWERHAEAWRHYHEEKQRREREAFFARYDKYLRSPAWRSLRQRVMRRAGGVCEGCLERRATQVHHLTYDHVFNEFAFELRAVCDGCHARLHQSKGVAAVSDEGELLTGVERRATS